MKKSFILFFVLSAIAGAIYLFAIEPAEAKLRSARAQLEDATTRHDIMKRAIMEDATTRARLQACETNMAAYAEAMMVPLLESTAMRAKSVLDPLAQGAGLHEIEYGEMPVRALPVPKRLPAQLHARCPIRVIARGSYQAAVSFLLRVEKEFPLVILEAFSITAQNDPAQQKAEFVFEWPIKGASTAQVKGGVRK